MTWRIVVVPRAEEDILRNAEWWARHYSTRQAARWISVVEEQLRSLANFPEGCGLSAEYDRFPYEIRDKLVGVGTRPTHRAVFAIRDRTVYVLTLRHAAQGDLDPNEVPGLP